MSLFSKEMPMKHLQRKLSQSYLKRIQTVRFGRVVCDGVENVDQNEEKSD